MSTASKASLVIAVVFATPFIGMGLFFAFTFGSAAWQLGNPAGYLAAAFGSMFAVLGFGIVYAAVKGYGEVKRGEALAATYPDSPWMWRDDWAQGHVAGRPAAAGVALWVVVVLIDALMGGAALVYFSKTNQLDPKILIFAIPFGGLALWLTYLAVKQSIRKLRYGSTWFEFTPGSLVPGTKMQGTVHLRLRVDTPHGFDVKLSCIRRITTGSGKNQTVTEEVLWSDAHNVDGTLVQRMMNDEALLPVEFMIPADAYETNCSNLRDRVLWKLDAKADVPGVDFEDSFEIPVYRTAASSAAMAAAAASGDGGGAPMFAGVRPQEVTPPANTKVKQTQDERGTVVEFGAFRNPRTAVVLTIFGAVWGGVVYLLFEKAEGGPIWIFRILFSLVLPLIFYGWLQAVFGSTVVAIRDSAVTVRKSLAGIGVTKSYPFAEIAKVGISDAGRTQGTDESAEFGVRLTQVSGGKVNIAASSLSRAEALWVASVIELAMGKSERIGVEFAVPFSRTDAPPQDRIRGGAGTNSTAMRTSKVGAVVGVGIFMMFMAGMVFQFTRNASNPRARSTQAIRKVVPAGPLTDVDVARLQNAAPQIFAEELLERSIRHDDRARELLMSRVGGMNLTMTETMKRLDQRSQYSRDLRVRQANVAVNLAAVGYRAEEGAAHALLESARQNRSTLASAVYYAGMLGSTENDKNDVVSELGEFALNDPDARVRQWAVEGLRFFDTDEALEIEWRSFTSDASMAVRDRAGCNVSDCGIFQRTKRFRYVPKLIELLEDPNQNAQMHSWAAMALGEITDARVAPTRAAWTKWYEENGEKKRAEFEALPWYSVRGDE